MAQMVASFSCMRNKDSGFAMSVSISTQDNKAQSLPSDI